MSITINKKPGATRKSGQELIYVVSSDKTTEAQFAYRIDILTGSPLTSILDEPLVKQANPTGNLIVDLSRIIDQELTPDFAAIKTTASNTNHVDGRKVFTVRFGEQYENSSGVLTNYTGAATETVGDNPAISDGTINVIKGPLLANDLDPTDSLSYSDGDLFGRLQEQYYNGDYILLSYWDGSESNINTYSTRITTNGDFTVNLDNDSSTSYTVSVEDYDGDFEATQFIWWNEDGGWESFTATEASTTDRNIDRLSSSQSNIQWGGSDGGIRNSDNSNIYKGSTNKYRNRFSSTITKQTQWLEDDESDALEGLYYSRWTYVRSGQNLIPIDVLDTSVSARVVQREKVLEQRQIRYRLSNDKRQV